MYLWRNNIWILIDYLGPAQPTGIEIRGGFQHFQKPAFLITPWGNMIPSTWIFYSQRSRHGDVVSGYQNIVNCSGLTLSHSVSRLQPAFTSLLWVYRWDEFSLDWFWGICYYCSTLFHFLCSFLWRFLSRIKGAQPITCLSLFMPVFNSDLLQVRTEMILVTQAWKG